MDIYGLGLNLIGVFIRVCANVAKVKKRTFNYFQYELLKFIDVISALKYSFNNEKL